MFLVTLLLEKFEFFSNPTGFINLQLSGGPDNIFLVGVPPPASANDPWHLSRGKMAWGQQSRAEPEPGGECLCHTPRPYNNSNKSKSPS